ncbi:MAG: hypothetical protein WBM09_05680 [Gallionella sp.]
METIYARVWQEQGEPDNVFAAQHCHGYDVYGDLDGSCKPDRISVTAVNI